MVKEHPVGSSEPKILFIFYVGLLTPLDLPVRTLGSIVEAPVSALSSIVRAPIGTFRLHRKGTCLGIRWCHG